MAQSAEHAFPATGRVRNEGYGTNPVLSSMLEEKRLCSESAKRVDRARRIHRGAYTDNFAAREHLKDQSSIERYRFADSDYAQAVHDREMGYKLEYETGNLQLELAHSRLTPEQRTALADRMMEVALKAKARYHSARACFDLAEGLLETIRQSHPEEAVRMFSGYHKMPMD